MPYNETPTKERRPVNPKLTKMVVKGAIGLCVSGMIGYMIKLEKKVDDKIDEHYDAKAKTENTQTS
jgi:preprotein translocase subunit Sss1